MANYASKSHGSVSWRGYTLIPTYWSSTTAELTGPNNDGSPRIKLTAHYTKGRITMYFATLAAGSGSGSTVSEFRATEAVEALDGALAMLLGLASQF